MLGFGFYEMERKDAIVVQVVPLSRAILDAGTAQFFICRTCQKTYGAYSNMCCREEVQPVVLVKALDSKWLVVKKIDSPN